ncbi:MAG TPA: CARDB domain-containing protein [Solirubrobacteraceae bacterium]
MIARRHLLALLTAASLLAAAPAHASSPAVTGTVAGAGGWTLVLLRTSGQSSTVRLAANGAFRLPLGRGARGATLQLLKPGGRYFGPVVLGRAGRGRVLTALSGRAGALGRIRLGAGYATAKAPKGAVSRAGAARADADGKPVGAGRLGLVAVKGAHSRARTAGAGGAGTDPDADGIPSALDADDDGNGKVDAVDSGSRSAGAGLFSEAYTLMSNSLNANAAGVDAGAIDRFVHDFLVLNFFLDGHQAKGATINSIDVDCLGLPYCRAGAGTGIVSSSNNSLADRVDRPWTSIDADGDKLPDVPLMPGVMHGQDAWAIAIRPRVTTAQIAPGDTFQLHFRTDRGDVVEPTALTLYFVTTPAVATAQGQKIAYPATDATLGNRSNPIMLDGDRVDLSFWRPQRAALPGEDGLRDMGHLHYGMTPHVEGGSNEEFGCGAGAYSSLSATLRPGDATHDSFFNSLMPLQDTSDDAAPSRDRTLGFTLDLGSCLRSHGIDPTGKLVSLPLMATDEPRPGGMDRAVQMLWVCFPGCSVPQQQAGPQQQQQGAPQQGGGPQPGGGLPDLAVRDLAASGSGGSCTLTWAVENRGTAAAMLSRTTVHTSGGDQEISLDSVAPGEARGQQATVPVPCADLLVQVTADGPNAIVEYAEDNNSAQSTF